MKLLLVEDNKDIAELIFDYFELAGATLDYAATGTHGATLASEETYDCIILDIMLPGVDGLTICHRLRTEGNNTPIIMLTARDTRNDLLAGFKDGADDYVVKPFELEVLQARINAVVRRSGGIGFQKEFICGPLKIQLNTRKVYRESTLLTLNPTCYSILLLLVKNHPSPTNKRDVERHLWGDDLPDSDILRKHIYQLRKVVDKPFATDLIRTIPKVGYVIEEQM